MGSSSQEQLLSLYTHLRGEILHADTQNYQVLAFTVAATAALLALGVNQAGPTQRAVIFALVYLVSWPCQRLLQGNRRRIWRVASYLRSVVEPQLTHVNWETDLSALHRKLNPSQRKAISTMVARNEWLIVSILNLGAALCLVGLSVLPAHIPGWQKALLICGIVLVNVVLSGSSRLQDVRLRRGDRVDALFGDAWGSPGPLSPATAETSDPAPAEGRRAG